MSKTKTAKRGRNTPQQARSKVTVEVILDGAIRVFDQVGAEAATTSRIAKAAGVSVGTLYQYFSNREDILDALQEREFDRARSMLSNKLSNNSYPSEYELARAVISGLLELYRAAPGLHRTLAIFGLHASLTAKVQAFDHQVVETLRVFFEMTSMKVERKNRHAAAFVLYHSVRATMLAAILENSVGMNDDVLVSEITDLVVSHLTNTF